MRSNKRRHRPSPRFCFSFFFKRTDGKGDGRCTEGGRRGGRSSRIPKVAGSGKSRGNLCNIAQHFALKKRKEAGANNYRAGTVINGYGKQAVKTPLFIPLHNIAHSAVEILPT